MKISTTKYNEVNPTELKKLFENGAELKKSAYLVGVFIGIYTQATAREYGCIHMMKLRYTMLHSL